MVGCSVYQAWPGAPIRFDPQTFTLSWPIDRAPPKAPLIGHWKSGRLAYASDGSERLNWIGDDLLAIQRPFTSDGNVFLACRKNQRRIVVTLDALKTREHGRQVLLGVRAEFKHGIGRRQVQIHDGEGGHLQMKQVADAVVLSQSATTRLVTRLEDRGLLERYLCPTDRRGIYTNVTPAGLQLLEEARPTNDTALREALDEAAQKPELAPLVRVVESLHAPAPAPAPV